MAENPIEIYVHARPFIRGIGLEWLLHTINYNQFKDLNLFSEKNLLNFNSINIILTLMYQQFT